MLPVSCRIALLAVVVTLFPREVQSQGHAVVSGSIASVRCEALSIGDASGAIGEGGAFVVRVPLREPSYQTASCGWRLPLFLAPGDSVHVTVSAAGEVAYEGRGAAANAYLVRTGGLVGRSFMQALYPLRRKPFETFAASWDSLRRSDEAALAAVASSAQPPAYFVEMERVRIQAIWAHGHLAYPVLNWRDGEASSIMPTPETGAAEAAVGLGDARRLVLPEFRAAARALVHEKAREMLRADSTYQTGDNRWLRAKYDWTVAHAEAPAVRDVLLAETFLTHLDQNGSENVEPLLARLATDLTDPALLSDVVRAYAEERRYWAGDRAETYKEIEGTTLEAHIERPAGADPDDRLPVFVWLHGGSFDTGAWYHCPFVCGTVRDEGMAVVRLEQRSADRFHTTPADQLADVRDALRWLRRNADRLRLDPERVVLGGFSSGATLSVMAAAVDEGGVSLEAVPDASVAIAACVAPLEGDGWFRASIAQAGDDPARFSPVHQVREGAAPLLLVHGTDDEYCEYEPVGPYAEAMEVAGNDVAVETLAGQPHFFLFRSPPGRSQALDAIRGFLRSRGLVLAVSAPAGG